MLDDATSMVSMIEEKQLNILDGSKIISLVVRISLAMRGCSDFMKELIQSASVASVWIRDSTSSPFMRVRIDWQSQSICSQNVACAAASLSVVHIALASVPYALMKQSTLLEINEARIRVRLATIAG